MMNLCLNLCLNAKNDSKGLLTKALKPLLSLGCMAHSEGFEPSTARFVALFTIQHLCGLARKSLLKSTAIQASFYAALRLSLLKNNGVNL